MIMPTNDKFWKKTECLLWCNVTGMKISYTQSANKYALALKIFYDIEHVIRIQNAQWVPRTDKNCWVS